MEQETGENTEILKNLHCINAESLEHVYTILLHQNELRRLLRIGEVAFFCDIDGVLTAGSLLDVASLSLHLKKLSTHKDIINISPNSAHFVFTSRFLFLKHLRDWVFPLQKTLSTGSRMSVEDIPVINFSPHRIDRAQETLIDTLKHKAPRAVITNLAKEGSTQFLQGAIRRVLRRGSNGLMRTDALTYMFEVISTKYKTFVITDNDDTIREKIIEFAQTHPEVELYYFSIPTHSTLAALRQLKQRYENWRNPNKDDNTP